MTGPTQNRDDPASQNLTGEPHDNCRYTKQLGWVHARAALALAASRP